MYSQSINTRLIYIQSTIPTLCALYGKTYHRSTIVFIIHIDWNIDALLNINQSLFVKKIA